MKKKIIALFLVMLLLFSTNALVLAESSFPDKQVKQSTDQALSYLQSVQNRDGGFPARKGGNSSNAVTSWVIMALAAAGENPASSKWSPGGKSPLDYLHNCEVHLVSTCDHARTLLSLTAANQGTVYQKQDLVKKIISWQQPSGQFAQLSQGEKGFINSHMWSIIALYSAGQEIPNQAKAKEWLLQRQNKDGGFPWSEGIASDADDTAAALQALILLGEDPVKSPAVKKALNYLKTCQEKDGGFRSGELATSKSNVNSDAWVIQGLLACGENPVGDSWSIGNKNAVNHLLSLQSSNGFFNWIQGVSASPVNSTAYAIIALQQKPFPIKIDYSVADKEEDNKAKTFFHRLLFTQDKK